jgi:class 3 adenylate cyclase
MMPPMLSERLQRRVDALLDEAEAAFSARDWPRLAELADDVLKLDGDNGDARIFAAASAKGLDSTSAPLSREVGRGVGGEGAPAPLPAAFGNGRYRVARLLGEGGRKQVYLARDTTLDRDIAIAVLRVEGLDDGSRERVTREARAMARMGAHPQLVTIFDISEENGRPFLVEEYMTGGDLSGLLGGKPMEIERALTVGKDVCRALAFMHRAGVVHRDLKPANVFVAADGTVKVGDFGLAMTGDLARLTQHGMLVGTVAYMAPEQALGQAITPAADLYALGAVLYEMVTGQPPFAGDAAAVLTQHLNTAPVAPSLHAPACPPSLEGLILRLLAKEPADRPVSADELLAALDAVDPHEKAAPAPEGHALDRLRKGVFVGREKELERLRSVFDGMLAGEGSVVMLVGEPGIGKTATARELESYARIRGAQVHWGLCHEASGAPPFWPWIQSATSWGAANDVLSLRNELGADAAELTRLFPQLRDLGFGTAQRVDDAPSAQFRLFSAVTAMVRAMANRSPLVLVLDDLHWADRPTLLLLQHVARELPHMRVLIVGTYRDTELARTHPLSETLAALNREGAITRVALRGLTLAETREYIKAATRVDPAAEVVRRIHDETEGNPFFVSQVVNLMAEEGTISRDSVTDIRLPEGVREALGRRLDRLSEDANELLKVAAIAGREFAYDTLAIVGGKDDDALLRLIEEGLAARVVEETGRAGHYRFTHALMQETLLDELSTTRRVRLHGQVGDALERRWAARADENAARLARHFVESATLAESHAAKAIHYCSLAGAAAYEQAAFAESERHYEAALSLREGQEIDHEMAVLLLGLGKAQAAQFKAREAWRALRRGLDVFIAAEDYSGVLDVGAVLTGLEFSSPTQLVVVDRALEALPAGTRERAELAVLAYEPKVMFGDLARALHLLDEAEAWLEGHADVALRARLELGRFITFRYSNDLEGCLVAGPGALSLEAHLPAYLRHDLHWHVAWFSLVKTVPEMEAARRHAALAAAWAERSGGAIASVKGAQPSACVAALGGDFAQARLHLDAGEVSYPGDPLLAAIRAYVSAEAGDEAAARAALSIALTAAERPELGGAANGLYGLLTAGVIALAGYNVEDGVARFLLEAAGRANVVAAPSGRAGHVLDRAVCCRAFPGLVDADEVLGQLDQLPVEASLFTDSHRAKAFACTALGDIPAAIAHYRDSLERSSQGLVTAHARTAYELAELLLGTGEPADAAEARGLLTTALDTARRVGMRPLSEQITRLLVSSSGVTVSPFATIDAVSNAVALERPNLAPRAAPDGTVTILFSDIEGSTALNVELGDEGWMELLGEHNRLVREAIRRHNGFEVKTEGDAFMVAFQSARDALRCAIDMQKSLAQRNAAAERPVRVRIGLHTGEPVRNGDDFYGTHVVLAARIASQASGGDILASALLRELVAASREFDLAPRPPVALKGLPGEHIVYSVGWS